MKPMMLHSQVGLCTLGAVNGLFLGLIAEQVRVIYLTHIMSRATVDYELHHPGWSVDLFYPDIEFLVPLVCTVASAGVAHLVYRYFIHRPRVLLLLWGTMGAFAVWAGSIMEPSRPNFFSFVWVAVFAVMSYSGYQLWTKHPQSLLSFWLVVGISAVITVAACVQLIGLFMAQRYELRSSLMWLLCLAVVVIVNPIYGFVIHFIFPRYRRKEFIYTDA
jgi:hypothetical protein